MSDLDSGKLVYEDMLARAISRIDVYTDEWKNRLPSDPGITVLENLTAFELLLLNHIRSMPEKTRLKILALFQVIPKKDRSARVLLGAVHSGQREVFPEHQKFYLDHYCFETVRETSLSPGKLIRVYLNRRGNAGRMEEQRLGNPVPAPIFGERPAVGDTVYLLFDDTFGGAQETVCLYAEADESAWRSSAPEDCKVQFARARWSYYTEDGYRDVLCKDDTSVFLKSGELHIELGKESPAKGEIQGTAGYILRCELLWQAYDQIPRVTSIVGPLFEVYEMDSKAVSFVRPYSAEIVVPDSFQGEIYVWVFGGGIRNGLRQIPCQREEGTGEITLHLLADAAMTGELSKQPVKIICMDAELAVQRKLGVMYGYDRQEFELAVLGKLDADSIEIMVEKQCAQDSRFWFFTAGDAKEGAVLFEYDAENHVIRILDPGDYEGCTVYLSKCAVFHGEEGSALPNNHFMRSHKEGQGDYYNPVQGHGGRFGETYDELEKRFRERMSHPDVLVTPSDYERAVREVPDLCIHKVQAVRRDKSRDMEVYVKPHGPDVLPQLGALYTRQIYRYLEERRLLGARIFISGPRYIAVDIWARIIVKGEHTGSRNKIQGAITDALNYVDNEQGFGQTISYRAVFKKVESLPDVASVEELVIAPQISLGAGQDACAGLDIRLPAGVLCYAGRIELILKRSRVI